MARLLEHEVFAAVLGEIVDQDHLSQLCTHKGVGKDSYSDCEEYNISHKSYFEDPVLSKMFKITECIKKRWNEKDIDFIIYLYLKDWKVVGGHHYLYRVFKDGVSETQMENLRDKIYHGKATRADITRLTRRLGDEIAAVYGFDIPKQRTPQERGAR